MRFTTYQYKIYNNSNYQKKFDRWVGICRLVYNLAKETRDWAYINGKSYSEFDLSKQLPSLKKESYFINIVGAHTLEMVIHRLYNRYKKFFKGGSFPKWAKKKDYLSIDFRQNENILRQTDKGFNLPKFGEVKVTNNRKINGKIRTATILQKADGLYLNVVVEQENTQKGKNQAICGIDMGITYFCTTSDGVQIDNPRTFEKYQKQLRVEQRSLSRKIKGSKSYETQKKLVAKLHKKIKDCRIDFLHKKSTTLANKYDRIIRENLNISGMAKSRLSKQIYDVSWATFFTMLEYKTNVIKVNPAYTSQKCSKCGHICKENRKTQSQFECISCGHAENADKQAAKNILQLGYQLLQVNVDQ